ncbi:hypothetical protein V8E51_001247 [Hyaloscypha variabilis]
MFPYSLFAISAIIICTVATTINQAVCTDLLITIEITATTFVPNFAPFNGSTEATNFMLQLLNGYTTAPFKGTQNNTSSFIISAQYCTPSKPSARSTTLHLMTSAAISAGYSTFAWDRLGSGSSSFPDEYTILQSSTELAVLIELTTKIRTKTLKPCTSITKIIHVGHSYGSELTHGLAATASINANQPERFAHLGNGYLTWPDQYALQYVYFSWPDFDPGVVAAFEENKWPLSTGQLLTHPAYVLPAPAFTGPVMVWYINGNNDLCYCFSNCTGLLTPALTELYFPNASVVEVFIHPSAGHALNLHYNSTAAYDIILRFLEKNI